MNQTVQSQTLKSKQKLAVRKQKNFCLVSLVSVLSKINTFFNIFIFSQRLKESNKPNLFLKTTTKLCKTGSLPSPKTIHKVTNPVEEKEEKKKKKWTMKNGKKWKMRKKRQRKAVTLVRQWDHFVQQKEETNPVEEKEEEKKKMNNEKCKKWKEKKKKDEKKKKRWRKDVTLVRQWDHFVQQKEERIFFGVKVLQLKTNKPWTGVCTPHRSYIYIYIYKKYVTCPLLIITYYY